MNNSKHIKYQNEINEILKNIPEGKKEMALLDIHILILTAEKEAVKEYFERIK